MTQLMLTLAIFIGSAFAAMVPGREVTYITTFPGGQPLFDKGPAKPNSGCEALM